MRLQLRYETHFLEGEARMLAAVRAGAVGYVVFNNHLPEAQAALGAPPGADRGLGGGIGTDRRGSTWRS